MFSFGSERKKDQKKKKILAASQSPGNTPSCPATNRAMIILAPAQVWALTSLNGRKVKPTCQKGHLEECSRCTEPAGSSSAPGKNKQFMNCANTRVLEKYTRWRVFYEAITVFVSKVAEQDPWPHGAIWYKNITSRPVAVQLHQCFPKFFFFGARALILHLEHHRDKNVAKSLCNEI